MASNTECLIIIIDVRQSAEEECKRKAIKYTAEVLKDKICSAKKDYVSFVLLGTQRTENNVNSEYKADGYYHIVQYPVTQLPTWQMLMNFFKFVNEEACEQGDWLDALVVAMTMIKSCEDTFKIRRRRILLFHDFDGPSDNYAKFDEITSKILEEDIQLNVVSSYIKYVDNSETGDPQAVYHCAHKSEIQFENEKYLLRLVSTCNAQLWNFDEALQRMLKVVTKSPWSWQAALSIGSNVNILVSGVIAAKDESNIKLKKVWAESDQEVVREVRLFNKGKSVEPFDLDMIDGYMLGGTPVAFDDSLIDDKIGHDKGLWFIGFTRIDSIPQEYFCGDSLYWIVHQKGRSASARKLHALVKALLDLDMAMLCWKIFSAKFNSPKLVVLLPNELEEDKPATLSMIDLAYHAQHHFWDFPALRTEKSECTPEQIQAIDNLIDSMDLLPEAKEDDKPRDTLRRDLLPFDMLPHIYEQNIIDILERKIILNAGVDDDQFLEMLNDKNFVDAFWKVPEPIEQKAKQAAEKVAKLFPLERNIANLEKLKARAAASNATKQQPSNKADVKPTALAIKFVGTENPADDFEQLLKHNVLTLNDRTERDTKFHTYASQMQTVIRELISDESKVEPIRIKEALTVYRACSNDFNALEEYNEWIGNLKETITSRRLYDLWRNVIVKENLGLCIAGVLSLEEKIKLEQFYAIEETPNNSQNDAEFNEDTDIDDFLASLSP